MCWAGSIPVSAQHSISLIFLPVGAVLRLLGKDPMSRKLNKVKASYRVKSPNPPDNHMERPF